MPEIRTRLEASAERPKTKNLCISTPPLNGGRGRGACVFRPTPAKNRASIRRAARGKAIATDAATWSNRTPRDAASILN